PRFTATRPMGAGGSPSPYCQASPPSGSFTSLGAYFLNSGGSHLSHRWGGSTMWESAEIALYAMVFPPLIARVRVVVNGIRNRRTAKRTRKGPSGARAALLAGPARGPESRDSGRVRESFRARRSGPGHSRVPRSPVYKSKKAAV